MQTRHQDPNSFFEEEEAEVERMVFIKDSGEEPRPQRVEDPPPRPKPKAISSYSAEKWIPAESRKKKKKDDDSVGFLSQVNSLVLYGLGLAVFLGGISFLVLQVVSFYS